MERRFWEVDALRGLAVMLMVAYHFAFDLDYFGMKEIDMASPSWSTFQTFIAAVFITIAGVSLSISKSKHRGYRHQIRHGSMILGAGLAITAVTWLALDSGTIIFGVLHLIGFSILISYPFLQKRLLSLIFGVMIILSGLAASSMHLSGMRYAPFLPTAFYTLDYFPLIPWFGVVLIGISIGDTLYKKGNRRFRIPDISSNALIKPICLAGRHSLLIYLIHQPILWALFYLMV